MASSYLNNEYLSDFINSCSSLLKKSERLKNTEDPAVVGDLCRRFETSRELTRRFVSSTNSFFPQETKACLLSLHHDVSDLYKFWMHKSQVLSNDSSRGITAASYQPELLYSCSQPGRPRLNIDMEKVKMLRNIGFTWKSICQKTGVSSSTMKRKVSSEPNISTRFTDISEEELELAFDRPIFFLINRGFF